MGAFDFSYVIENNLQRKLNHQHNIMAVWGLCCWAPCSMYGCTGLWLCRLRCTMPRFQSTRSFTLSCSDANAIRQRPYMGQGISTTSPSTHFNQAYCVMQVAYLFMMDTLNSACDIGLVWRYTITLFGR